MIIWRPDTCTCRCNYEIVDDIVTGELIEPCLFHTTFEDTLNTNRLKNTAVNTINEVIDMTDKSINFSFNYENGIITLTLHNFTVEDMDIINLLDLNVDVIQG